MAFASLLMARWPWQGSPKKTHLPVCRNQRIRIAPGDLHLYFDDVYSLPGPERIEWASRAEAAALEADPRITNSNGGSFDAATGRKVLANSRGFVGGYRTSYAGVSAAPLAKDANGQMQRDGWWSGARAASQTWNRRSPSAKKPRGVPCAGSAPGAFPPSRSPSYLRPRWRDR